MQMKIKFHMKEWAPDLALLKTEAKGNSQMAYWQITPCEEAVYSAANDPQTANDPQIGPQMIPNRKWSPMWTANDPAGKQRMAWMVWGSFAVGDHLRRCTALWWISRSNPRILALSFKRME